MTLGTLVFVGLGAALLFFGGVGFVVGIYNSLVQVRNNVDKAFKNIDVLLQQRHDELGKQVEAVAAYAKHERDVLDRLTRLRAGYGAAATQDEKIRLENDLNREAAKLRHVWEAYPDLQASQAFLQLQQRVAALESSIADRREFFNDSVNIHNIQIERFPELILARMLGYRRKEYLAVPDEKRADVSVAAR